MRIDSSGNVLVGTTTAAGNMTVNMGNQQCWKCFGVYGFPRHRSAFCYRFC
jgi:hypothetical protein